MRLLKFAIGVSVLAALIIALIIFEHVISAHIAKPDSNAIAVVGFTAALVALAGLIVNSWIAIRNSRKQHTMDVLLQTRLDQKFWDRADLISGTFPEHVEFDPQILNAEENKKAKAAVIWILNFYEFIATGIRHGDLDEPLMRDCLCTQFCTFCRRAELFIKAERPEDEFGNPSQARRRILKSVKWLYPRWQRKINHPLVPFWFPMWWPVRLSN